MSPGGLIRVVPAIRRSMAKRPRAVTTPRAVRWRALRAALDRLGKGEALDAYGPACRSAPRPHAANIRPAATSALPAARRGRSPGEARAPRAVEQQQRLGLRSMLVDTAAAAGTNCPGRWAWFIGRPVGLLDGLADPRERLGQVERLGHLGQPLGDQPPVVVALAGTARRLRPSWNVISADRRHGPCRCGSGMSLAGKSGLRVGRHSPIEHGAVGIAGHVTFVRQDQATGNATYSRTASDRLPVGADHQRLVAGLGQQRLADLLAEEVRFERRAVEDLLGPIRLDRRRAVELQRPPAVEHQIAAEQPCCGCSKTVRNPKVGFDFASPLSVKLPIPSMLPKWSLSQNL